LNAPFITDRLMISNTAGLISERKVDECQIVTSQAH
jgi:hypothetical protein